MPGILTICPPTEINQYSTSDLLWLNCQLTLAESIPAETLILAGGSGAETKNKKFQVFPDLKFSFF